MNEELGSWADEHPAPRPLLGLFFSFHRLAVLALAFVTGLVLDAATWFLWRSVARSDLAHVAMGLFGMFAGVWFSIASWSYLRQVGLRRGLTEGLQLAPVLIMLGLTEGLVFPQTTLDPAFSKTPGQLSSEISVYVIGVSLAFKTISRFINRSFKIFLFRPFVDDLSALVRKELAPTLGAYGQIHVVTDSGFEVLRVRTLLGFSGDSLVIPEDQPVLNNENWQAEVLALMDECNLAVVDVSRASPNIEWETRSALQRIGERNLLFVASEGTADPSFLELCRQLEMEDDHDGSIRKPLAYRDGFLGSWQFRWNVYRWMRSWTKRRLADREG